MKSEKPQQTRGLNFFSSPFFGPDPRGKEATREALGRSLSGDVEFLGLEDRNVQLHLAVELLDSRLAELDPDVVVFPSSTNPKHHQDHIQLDHAMRNIMARRPYVRPCWLASQPVVSFDEDPGFAPNLYYGFDTGRLRELELLRSSYRSERYKDYFGAEYNEIRAKKWGLTGNLPPGTFAEPFHLLRGVPPVPDLMLPLFRINALGWYVADDGSRPLQDFLDDLSPLLRGMVMGSVTTLVRNRRGSCSPNCLADVRLPLVGELNLDIDRIVALLLPRWTSTPSVRMAAF